MALLPSSGNSAQIQVVVPTPDHAVSLEYNTVDSSSGTVYSTQVQKQ